MNLERAGRLATVAGLVRDAPGPGSSPRALAEALGDLFAEVAVAGPGLRALWAGIERCRADRVLVVRADARIEPGVWLALVAAPSTQLVVPAEPDPEFRLLLIERRAALALATGAEAPVSIESLLASLTLRSIDTRPLRVLIPSE